MDSINKKLILPLIIVLICLLLCIISEKIVYKIFKYKNKKFIDKKKKTIINLINNLIQFVIVIIGILIVLETYGVDTISLVTSLGVVSLVAGLALQDSLKDLITGITIIFQQEYSIGDWVSINGFKGEVMPSGLRTTKLRAYTGEIKIIFNRNITEIINYSLSNANLIIDTQISRDSDVEKVKEILNNLCIEFKEKHNLQEIFCAGLEKITSTALVFRIIVKSPYSTQFNLEREIKTKIYNELEKENIKIV